MSDFEDNNDRNSSKNIQDEYTPIKERHSNLYINPSLNKKIEDKNKFNYENNEKQFNFNKYLVVICFSVLIYICCVWISQLNITDIVDLELPILILTSLIITFFCENTSRLITYIIVLIISVVLYTYIPEYTFLIVVSLLAQICIDCITNIYKNKNDYRVKISTDKFF